MGFAVYLNLLERVLPEPEALDADVLILHDGSDPEGLMREIAALEARGVRVRADRAVPEGLRYGKLLTYAGGEVHE